MRRYFFIETSEKSHINVILRSEATKNLSFPLKNKNEILRFAQNDNRQPIFQMFLIVTFFVSLCTSLSAQIKGDFFITYGFAFPSGGYLSFRYYPEEKIGVEIYSSAFWNIFNYGAKINIHTTTSLPNTFISIGYSHITAYNPFILSDTSVGRILYLSRLAEGIDLGIGRDVGYDYKHFSFQVGPTYVLNLKDSFFNERREIETINSPILFSYFFVGTMLAQLPEKNPKPVYVK